ncbi:MAG: type IV conjugative transfer system protein TraL [Puia sp.]|nr:type IV conjugative transfer system protein TraL [Puia sp.]
MAAYRSEFPQYMSLPTEVLWWGLDQVAIAALSFTVAILQSGVVVWIGFFLVNYLYGRTKHHKPRGYMKHMAYMLGFAKVENYPEYFQQEFHE